MNTAKKARKELRTKISQAISVVLTENSGADPEKVAKAARKSSRKLAEKFMPTGKAAQPVAEGIAAQDGATGKKKKEKKAGKKGKAEVTTPVRENQKAPRLVS